MAQRQSRAAGGVSMETNSLPQAWDAFDVYLFDIDGTLLHCTDAVHYFAFCNALSDIAGRPMKLDGVVAHGNTDVGILRDALHLAGVEEEDWRPRLAEIRQSICAFVQQHEQDLCVELLPGVRDVMEHLRSKGAILGVATGNLQAIGTLKLARADLLPHFRFCGWSDDFENRADVFRAAVAQARRIAAPGASICVVGDTPSDVLAAHENGLPVIAVATGTFSLEELRAAGPELCVRSLEELRAPAHWLPA